MLPAILYVKYTTLGEQLQEVGRMLGGWKKGLESKTPHVK